MKSIARQFLMLDSYVLAQLSAEICWWTYELLHWNLYDDQWATENCLL
jgi:hypothetical protein